MPDNSNGAAAPDLTKLRINRDLAPVRSRKRRRWVWLGVVAIAAVAGGAWFAMQPRALTVTTTPIVTAFPSQQFVVLNATGYVVAQRKAAISSKATGRLEWLGVAEGDIIARIDARDVIAQSESADASVVAARASLVQAQAEETDAAAQLKRNQDLLSKGFVSAASVDTAKARADRATACPQPTKQQRDSARQLRAVPASFPGGGNGVAQDHAWSHHAQLQRSSPAVCRCLWSREEHD